MTTRQTNIHPKYKRKTGKASAAGTKKEATAKKKGKTKMGLKEEAKKKGKTKMGLKEEAKKKGKTEMGLKEAAMGAKKQGKMEMVLTQRLGKRKRR